MELQHPGTESFGLVRGVTPEGATCPGRCAMPPGGRDGHLLVKRIHQTEELPTKKLEKPSI